MTLAQIFFSEESCDRLSRNSTRRGRPTRRNTPVIGGKNAAETNVGNENTRAGSMGALREICDRVIEPLMVHLLFHKSLRVGLSEWIGSPSRRYEPQTKAKWMLAIGFSARARYAAALVAALRTIRNFCVHLRSRAAGLRFGAVA